MKTRTISLLIAGAALPLAAMAQVTSQPLAKWDFSLETNYDKTFSEVQATGSAVGSNGYTFSGNLAGGRVIEISPDKYAFRANGTGTQLNTGALTGVDVRESFSLRVDIAGWDLTNTTGTSTLFNFETRVQLTGGYPLGQFALRRYSDGTIGFALYGGTSTGGTPAQWSYPTDSFAAVHGAMIIDLFYDMTDNTMTLSYSTDSGLSWIEAGSGFQFTGLVGGQERIPAAVYMVQQLRMGNGSYIDINSISLVQQVPEPSTYALLGGALALGFVVAKRRRAATRS